VELIQNENFGMMVAARGEDVRPVPIADVAGGIKLVPRDHSWIISARHVGTCFGD